MPFYYLMFERFVKSSHACAFISQRMVTEYNVLMGRLSGQEKGIFRNKLVQLERRVWNGIYKITWQNLASIREEREGEGPRRQLCTEDKITTEPRPRALSNRRVHRTL